MTATRSRAGRAVYTATRDDPRLDSELLARFVTHHDAAAFAAIVRRHGPLVYGVCRRTLGATADADDAFQSAFLVLAQKAGAVPWRGGLGPWLFGVAHRISRKARFKRDRRFAIEKQVEAMPHPETTSPDLVESDELSRAFDEELAALPEDMRRAVVLCELQGRSRQQAAKELRIGEGTLSSRLARARKLLRDRLAKRGFGLVIPAAVGVSTKLTAGTVALVDGSAGVVPAAVAALTQEAVKAMTISKLKLGAVLAAVAVGVTACGVTAHGRGDEKQVTKAEPPVKQAAKVEPPKVEEAKPKKRLRVGAFVDELPPAVATIGGQDVSREEFAEYLIRKHGAKEIELFVNQKIIETEAKKRGVTVSDAEVEAEFLRELDGLNISRSMFVTHTLPKYGKTQAEWRDDVLRPRLVLEKLCQKQVGVTEDDLRRAFENKHGEKRVVSVRSVSYSGATDEVAGKVQTGMTRLATGSLADAVTDAAMFKRWVVTRHPTDPDVQPIADAVFALRKVDDVTAAVRMPNQDRRYELVLVEIIPAATGKTFDDKEKAELFAEVAREKTHAELPKHFARLKADAKPVFHIQPAPKTYPQPLPAKK